MDNSSTEIAQQLKDNTKKVQLIYAFNGNGKTRLSREFKILVPPETDGDIEVEGSEVVGKKIIYYNAFTEDLFYWDNDLENDAEPKLKIHPNSFTKWIFEEQGQEQNSITNFQRYTDEKLMPHFNEAYTTNKDNGRVFLLVPLLKLVFFMNEEMMNIQRISKYQREKKVTSYGVFFIACLTKLLMYLIYLIQMIEKLINLIN